MPMSYQPSLFDDDSDIPDNLQESNSDSLMQTGWIRALLNLPGVGSKRAMKIITQVQSAERLLTLSPKELHGLVKIDLEFPRGFAQIQEDLPENFRIIGFFDRDFPKDFRDLPDPPLVIWCRGDLPKDKTLTIVGTRRPTSWGEKVAEAAGEISAEVGVTTVSGLALGIDVAAHKGSLEHGGKTVAILGSGIDKVTPRVHSKLADEIVEKGGCLLSEVAPGTEPSAHSLVARNRLQAALGRALLMVQCGIPSGTLHTVRFARNLGRPIAVPHPPLEVNLDASAGNTALLANSIVGNRMLKTLNIPASSATPEDRLADVCLTGIESLRQFIQEL